MILEGYGQDYKLDEAIEHVKTIMDELEDRMDEQDYVSLMEEIEDYARRHQEEFGDRRGN